MINKMKIRTGGYKNGVANSAKYLLKTEPEGDSIDCSIERLEGESNQAYANRIEKIFESARVPNQKNLYQHTALAFHPTDGEKLTDAQMIDIAKEVYLKNGLGENRHYLFVVERNTDHPHVHALLHLTDLHANRVNNKFIKYNPILEKLENKYGLYNLHRTPTPTNTKPSNEKLSERNLKNDFREELKAILERALTASEFLILIDGAGFNITHNSNESYSLTKNGKTFKASDLGLSYKALKGRLGYDPNFSATLVSLHKEKPRVDDFGAFVGATSEIQNRKKRHRTLDLNFDTLDDNSYRYKDSERIAFEYDKSGGKVSFQSSNRMAIKAGLQRLIDDMKPGPIYISGTDAFKKNAWIEFHMMNLEKKGYSISGYRPTAADHAALKKLKEEQEERYRKKQDDSLTIDQAQQQITDLIDAHDKKHGSNSKLKAFDESSYKENRRLEEMYGKGFPSVSDEKTLYESTQNLLEKVKDKQAADNLKSEMIELIRSEKYRTEKERQEKSLRQTKDHNQNKVKYKPK